MGRYFPLKNLPLRHRLVEYFSSMPRFEWIARFEIKVVDFVARPVLQNAETLRPEFSVWALMPKTGRMGLGNEKFWREPGSPCLDGATNHFPFRALHGLPENGAVNSFVTSMRPCFAGLVAALILAADSMNRYSGFGWLVRHLMQG